MTSLHEHLIGKEHVIWDWNGTLLNDLDHALRAVNQILSEEKIANITLAEYRAVFGFPVIEYYRKLGIDVSPTNFARLCERFNQIFHDELHRCDLWPGARETLAHNRSEGRLQSVLSASEHNLLLASIKLFDLENYFDHVVGIADKQAGSKVQQGRELLERTNVARPKTVLIGDTDHDLEVGKALGIDVILVEHGHQEASRLRALHPRVLKIF